MKLPYKALAALSQIALRNQVIVIGENGEVSGETLDMLDVLKDTVPSIEYTKRNKVELFELQQHYADGYRKPNKPNRGLKIGSYKSKNKNKAK